MLGFKTTARTPDAIRAQRKQLLHYVRVTGRVTCAIEALAWQLGIASETVYAAAGAGWADNLFKAGAIAEFKRNLERDAEQPPQAFLDGFNAALQYRKLAAQMEG